MIVEWDALKWDSNGDPIADPGRGLTVLRSWDKPSQFPIANIHNIDYTIEWYYSYRAYFDDYNQETLPDAFKSILKEF